MDPGSVSNEGKGCDGNKGQIMMLFEEVQFLKTLEKSKKKRPSKIAAGPFLCRK